MDHPLQRDQLATGQSSEIVSSGNSWRAETTAFPENDCSRVAPDPLAKHSFDERDVNFLPAHMWFSTPDGY
jgi:hypothetical protein